MANSYKLRLTLLWVSILLLLQQVFAQSQELGDWREWFSNPVAASLAVVGATSWVRKQWPRIDGPVLVPLTSIVIGLLGGAAGQLFGMLVVQPFSDLGFPWGGLLYGLAAALTGVIGVNVFDLVASRIRPAKAPREDVRNGQL
jgi:hypothetical protein